MPIYEYTCSGCDATFEFLRSLSQSDEEASCPHCQEPARRKLSTFACFSTDHAGIPTAIGGTGSSCSSCSSGSCGTCGH
ncbi:FmdB family zinc ribbon protein [Chloroflexota bacterium]